MIQVASEPFNNRVYQKNGAGVAEITKSITFDGSPSSLEYRVVDSLGGVITDWAEFDSSPTGGASTLTFNSAASLEKKFVEVRKQPSLESTQEALGWYVGNIVLITGQSLAEELNTIGTALPLDGFFVWNGTNPAPTSVGSGSRQLAKTMIEVENCPVLIINTAVGGSALSFESGRPNYWNDESSSLWIDTLNAVNTATQGENNIRFNWWHQGSADSVYNVSTTDYTASLTSFFNRVKSTFFNQDGGEVPIFYAQYAKCTLGSRTDEQRQNIRKSQIEMESIVDGAYPVNTFKFELRDGIHLTDTGYENLARELAYRFYSLSSQPSNDGLRVTEIRKSLSESNEIELYFNQSISDGGLDFSLEGVKVVQNGADLQTTRFYKKSNLVAAIVTIEDVEIGDRVTLCYGKGLTDNAINYPSTQTFAISGASDSFELTALAIDEQPTLSPREENMTLVPYRVTALAESDAQGTDGKNIVAGAIVSFFDQAGSPVILYDDENQTNGSTAKQTDSKGQVVVYVEPGVYELRTNGDQGRFLIVNSVISVFGRTDKNITAQFGDYNDSEIENTSLVAGNSTRAALNNLNSRSNISVFGGVAADDLIGIGFATSSTSARFPLPITSETAPIGASLTGTFKVLSATGTVTHGSALDFNNIGLGGATSNRWAYIFITSGISGMTAGDTIQLFSETAESKITLNF